METETYKKAKQILEQFDPEAVKKHEPPRPPGLDLRQRGVAMRPMGGAGPVAPGGPPERSVLCSPVMQGPLPGPLSPRPGALHPPGPPLARPILPRERGTVDRLVEYMVGDGPQNRYALICKQCFSHNGMALKEEFEYLAFRCAYCYFLNPARKTRPQAPRLPEFNYERRLRAEDCPSSSTSRGDTPPNADEAELEEETISEKEVSDGEEAGAELHVEEEQFPKGPARTEGQPDSGRSEAEAL